jgi:hypothetical protein
VDSVLDGLEPPVDAGILNIRNSTVRFVRLTVKSCILSGTQSSTLNLGDSDHAMWESLTIQDSNFKQNSGNINLGSDGSLIVQTSGKLLINNTHFIGNTASEGGQLFAWWLGVASPFFSLKIYACTFRNNTAGFSGASVLVYGTTMSEVLDCSFENNRGSGGVLLLVTTPPWQHSGSLLVRVYHAVPISELPFPWVLS